MSCRQRLGTDPEGLQTEGSAADLGFRNTGTPDASVTRVVGIITAPLGYNCRDQAEAGDPRTLAGRFPGMGRRCVPCLDSVPPRSASLA